MICRKCAHSLSCLILPPDVYFTVCSAEESLQDLLRVPTYEFNNMKLSYGKIFAEKTIPYAEKRKKRLISELKNRKTPKNIIEKVENFNTELFYTGKDNQCWKKGADKRFIAQLLGKNELTEHFPTSVTQFLGKITRKWSSIAFTHGSNSTEILTYFLD